MKIIASFVLASVMIPETEPVCAFARSETLMKTARSKAFCIQFYLWQRSYANITPSGAVYYQIVKANKQARCFRKAFFMEAGLSLIFIIFRTQFGYRNVTRFKIFLPNCYALHYLLIGTFPRRALIMSDVFTLSASAS